MTPELLLHVCCGVCSAYVPERLLPDFDVTVYFENSNLYPTAEFFKRREAAMTMAQKFGLKFITADQDAVGWFKTIRGHAKDPERGERCAKCINFRLDKTFAYAKQNDFKWIATTLSVSRKKNVDLINTLGKNLSDKYALDFLGKDWKKENGELISQQRAKEAGIYRQDYCGCVYSYVLRHSEQ